MTTYRERFDAFSVANPRDRKDLMAIHRHGIRLLSLHRHMTEVDETIAELEAWTEIPARRIAALIRKHGPAIGASYLKSDYAASGTGAFGHLNPSMKGTAYRIPAAVIFHRSH